MVRSQPVLSVPRHLEAEAASRWFVALGRDGGRGLKTLIARGEVLDILVFLAAVNRIADLLAAEGDLDGVEVRRSRAVGILGQPDRAMALLGRHQHDLDAPPAPVEPRSAGGWRRTSDSDGEPDAGEAATAESPPACSDDTAGQPEPRDADEPADDQIGPESAEPGNRSLDLAQPVNTRHPVASVRVQLYVHLTDAALNGTDPDAVCRVEGVGPVTVRTVRSWLRRSDAKVTVRPLTVPGDAIPVDGYEIPHGIREAVLLRNPASAFPWGWCTDRHSLQLDHVRRYLAMVRGGPPGRTDPANLAPLVQTEHQPKTSGRWRERTPAPGVYLWRSPHGWIHLVTDQGTFPLGNGDTAQAIWHATAPAEAVEHGQRPA